MLGPPAFENGYCHNRRAYLRVDHRLLYQVFVFGRSYAVPRASKNKDQRHSTHNAPFGNTAGLAVDNATSSRHDRSCCHWSSHTALRDAHCLAVNDRIGWCSIHENSKEQRKASTR